MREENPKLEVPVERDVDVDGKPQTMNEVGTENPIHTLKNCQSRCGGKPQSVTNLYMHHLEKQIYFHPVLINPPKN